MSKLPEHLAIVMDGNGRWAEERQMPRIAGHEAGVRAARMVIESCAKKKIPVLTLFAFSSENWRRPKAEVSAIMELFLQALNEQHAFLTEHNIVLRFIGDRARFEDFLIEKIEAVERLTENHTGMKLLIAADYGGQWDICQAAKKIAAKIEAQEMTSEEISPELLAKHLSFADLPDPDFFIRTSGEYRVSNFMLWQLAYSELYFTDTLWPDFSGFELNQALMQYSQRQRRFGLSGEQLECLNNA